MSPPEPISLTIRPLWTVDQLAQAYQLYLDHAGGYLPVPTVEVLYDAMKGGLLFACFHEDGRIVGVGGTFLVAHAREAGGAPIGVYEVAGLVVHPQVRGLRPYGVQDVLVVVRAAALTAQQSDAVCVISSVATDNSSSRKSMARCGFVELPEERVPQWLLEVRRTWMAGRRPEVVDHVLPPGAVTGHGDLIDRIVTAPVSAIPDDPTSQTYQFRFEDESVFENVFASFTSIPDWLETVPAQRLLGSGSSFVPWPR